MSTTIKAAFSLNDFQIPSFSFQKLPNETTIDDVNISFTPKGQYSKKQNIFILSLEFSLFVKETKKSYINTTILGFFEFENAKKLEDVPSYFYKNSIAILYPYLRSFVSSLTLQANIQNIILPTMNLSSLEPELKNATIEVE